MANVAVLENCNEIITKDGNSNLTSSGNMSNMIEDFSTLSCEENINENMDVDELDVKKEIDVDKITVDESNGIIMTELTNSENQNAKISSKVCTNKENIDEFANLSTEAYYESKLDEIILKANTLVQEDEINATYEKKEDQLSLQDEIKLTGVYGSCDVNLKNQTFANDTNEDKTTPRNVIIDYIIDRVIYLTQEDEVSNILSSDTGIHIVAKAVSQIVWNLRSQFDAVGLDNIGYALNSEEDMNDSSDVENVNKLAAVVKRKILDKIVDKHEPTDPLITKKTDREVDILKYVGMILLNSEAITEILRQIDNVALQRNSEKLYSENYMNGIDETDINTVLTSEISSNAEKLDETNLVTPDGQVEIDDKVLILKEDLGNQDISKLPLSENNGESDKLSSCTISSDKTSSERVSSNPKNSEDDFTPPDDELCEKIIRQVEYCFSDFNIMKDSFLLKHVRRNKEGYVSLKLVASFRKVKSLTKDWRVVAHCVEKSKKLKINEEKTKVCRIDPVPEYKDTPFAKTVVVFNLPFENPTSENVSELFSNIGTVVSASILVLGNELDNPFAKRCLSYHSDIASRIYAMIEFKEYEEAHMAIYDEQGHLAKENGLKVVPLLSQAYKNKMRNPKPQDRKKRRGRDKGKVSLPQPVQKDSGSSDERLGIDHQKTGPSETSKLKTILSNSQQLGQKSPRRCRGRKQVMSPNNSSNQKEHICVDHAYSSQGDGINKNYWKPRRQLSGNNSININNYMAPVIRARQPIGPDGTKGFRFGKYFENTIGTLKYNA